MLGRIRSVFSGKIILDKPTIIDLFKRKNEKKIDLSKNELNEVINKFMKSHELTEDDMKEIGSAFYWYGVFKGKEMFIDHLIDLTEESE